MPGSPSLSIRPKRSSRPLPATVIRKNNRCGRCCSASFNWRKRSVPTTPATPWQWPYVIIFKTRSKKGCPGHRGIRPPGVGKGGKSRAAGGILSGRIPARCSPGKRDIPVMLNYILSGGIVFFLALPAHSQMKPAIRYRDDVFPAISVQKDLSYATDTTSGKRRSHLFDWYDPKHDSARMRPLIIWMHGGGFKFGSKDMEATRLWSAGFARRGYVCAAINYR